MPDNHAARIRELQQEIAELEVDQPTATGRYAHMIAERLPEAHAELVALLGGGTPATPPSAELGMEASNEATISGSPQTVVGGELRDSAIGQGNNVLHHIRIESGGILVVGGQTTSVANPEAVRVALASYFRTLVERYQLLNLQGLGASESHRLQVTLQAVFVNLTSDQNPLMRLFSEGRLRAASHIAIIATDTPRETFDFPGPHSEDLSADERQWFAELLDEREHTKLFNLPAAFTAPQADEDDQERDEADEDEQNGSSRDEIIKRLRQPRTALELIRHYPALVLLGDPGSGKTTVMRFLSLGFAVAWLQAGEVAAPLDPTLRWQGNLPTPVFIQLRRFAAELNTPPTGADALLRHLEFTLQGDRFQALAGHLEYLLEQGSALVLLDGLDEIAEDKRRGWAVKAITLFQQRFPRSRVVVTCRTYAYRAPCELPAPFVVVRVQPLQPDAQNDFITRWYRAALLTSGELAEAEREPEASRRARGLIAGIDVRPRLRELAENPLLLTMIALLNVKRPSLPQQRAELYNECLDLLLEQWEQRRAEGEPAGLAAALGVVDKLADGGSRLALVQPVAYELQKAGREEATQREVGMWLLDRFLDLADNDGKRAKALIKQFLDFLEGRSGLLIARDLKERYAFPHKTFQEYLVARELVYLGEKELLAQTIAQRHAAGWREVILLAVGHLVATGSPDRARRMGWELLAADPEGSEGYWRSAALAGEVVDELRGNLGSDGRALRNEVVQRLVALLEGGHLTLQERVAAAGTLGNLGDPRALFPDHASFWCSIPAGSFWFGDDRENAPLEQMTLDYDFQISRFPVTNALYQEFLDAQGGMYDPQAECWTEHGRAFLAPGRHQWDDPETFITLPRLWHDTTFKQPNQPVVGVSWYEAAAFCRWLTTREQEAGRLDTGAIIRLPTALEWEYAARGNEPRRYPWGDAEPTPEHANYDETGIGRPSPVGCFLRGAAPCGAFDMAGNVMEWLATPYEKNQQVEAKKDFTPSDIVLRTNSKYRDIKEQLGCGVRFRNYPGTGFDIQGFRVLLSPLRIV